MLDIFDLIHPTFKFDKTKPIRLFEAFAGVGTQAMALKRLGINFENVGISEVDKHAINSYNAIHGETNNLGGVGTFEQFPPNIDLMTWSFPCTDISLAGTQKGMKEGTRSYFGFVFLDTIANMSYEDRPQVMLMENVKALLSKPFQEDWRDILLRLEQLGYTNYPTSLIATDYGIPQTRDRVFIVSIKGEYNYNYPKPIKLEKRLKDYLEKIVDEKYYLTQDQIEQILDWNAYQKPLDNAKFVDDEVIQTITAKSNTDMNASMLLIKEHTSKGYKEAKEGDGIYINRPHQKRGVVQEQAIQTIKTHNDDLGVIVPTLLPLNSKVNGEQPSLQDRVYDSRGVDASSNTSYATEYLTVRKLTPKEAWRLMGISDEDYQKVKDIGTSDTQLYKQAGNAIVVDVLMAIFKELF